MTTSFNLVDDPWISVQRQDGTPDELSLSQAFEQSQDVRSLSGDVPTQGFANLRLLLAVLYCASEPWDRDDWIRLWRGGPPLDQLRPYLDKYRHRFDIFDLEVPFYQVASLRTATGKVDGLEKIIADVPNGWPYQTTRAGAGLARIDASEAARWLVHVQAYDPSGIRSAAVGDPHQKAGKGYPIGPGWAGRLGGIVLTGENLWQTLLMNCVPLGVFDHDFADDLAPWERPADTALRQDFSEGGPRGPVHLLTLQSRRVRLVGNVDGVTGVVLSQGDRLLPQNRMAFESMTAWRYSKPQSAKFNTHVYMPRGHTPERSLWRNTAALLPVIPGGEPPPTRPPRTSEWLAKVAEVLGRRGRVGLQAIGMAYGSNESTVAEIINDTVDLSITVMRAESAEVAAIIDDAVRAAEAAVREAGRLAANLTRAAGERGEEAGDAAYAKATEDGFARLEQPGRRWLAALTADAERERVMATWERTVYDIVFGLGNELVEQASPAAATGRMIETTYINTPLADIWFRTALARSLPRAASQLRAEFDRATKE